jgi:hypothetical protein
LVPVKAPQSATVRATGAAATIAFANVGLVRAEPSADELEVTLRFDGAFDAKLADQIAAALPGWIAFATPGYDSLLIRTAKKAAFSVQASATGFDLRIAWAADPDAVIRHNAQTLRTLTAKGETVRARAMLSEMRRTAAPRSQMDRAEAELLIAERDPRAALRLYERISAAEPEDTGLRRQIVSLRHDLSDWIEAGVTHQSVKDGDDQTRYALRGRMGLTANSSAEIEFETVALTDDAVQRTDGTIGPADVSPVRLRAGLETDEGAGFLWGATLHLGDAGLGAGASAEWRGARQDLVLRAAYREPYFGLVESIADAGVRDSVEAIWRLRRGQFWRAELGLRYARYGLDGVDDAATAFGVQAGAAYDVPLGEDAFLTFAYGLDAEYVDSVAVLTDAFGATFMPLALIDREVHSLSLGVTTALTDALTAEALAGYAYDRYAEGGLFARAELAYDVSPAWAVAATASYAEVNARGTGGGAVTAAGLALRYRTGGPGSLWRPSKEGASR